MNKKNSSNGHKNSSNEKVQMKKNSSNGHKNSSNEKKIVEMNKKMVRIHKKIF